MLNPSLPPRVLSCLVTTATGMGSWPYNDGSGDPYWSGGANARDYRWRLTITVTPQTHSSTLTRARNTYDGIDVRVGDYIARAQDGLCVRIIRIDRKSETSLTCIVEDVLRYNTFRDPSGYGLGIFEAPTNAVIFEARNRVPCLDPLPASGVGSTFFPNLMSRFDSIENLNTFIINKPNHGFKVGQLVGTEGGAFVAATTGGPFVFGSTGLINPKLIGSVGLVISPNDFVLLPFTDIVETFDSLPGQVGDILYSDPLMPSQTRTISEVTTPPDPDPVMVKLRNHTATQMLSTKIDATCLPGWTIGLNGVDVTVGGIGTLADLRTSINLKSGQHGVTAQVANGRLTITAPDSRPINIIDRIGTPMDALGLFGVENGTKAAAVYVTKARAN